MRRPVRRPPIHADTDASCPVSRPSIHTSPSPTTSSVWVPSSAPSAVVPAAMSTAADARRHALSTATTGKIPPTRRGCQAATRKPMPSAAAKEPRCRGGVGGKAGVVTEHERGHCEENLHHAHDHQTDPKTADTRCTIDGPDRGEHTRSEIGWDRFGGP